MARALPKFTLLEWAAGGVLTLAVLLAYLADWTGFQRFNSGLEDALLSLNAPVQQSDSVVIIGIDDESLAKIGPWPWPRATLAALIEPASQAGAKVIGVTVPLSEPDHTQGLEELRAIERKLLAQTEALRTVKELRAIRKSLATPGGARAPESRDALRTREIELRLLQDLYRELLQDVRAAEARLDQDSMLASVIAATPQMLLPWAVEIGPGHPLDASPLGPALVANAFAPPDESAGLPSASPLNVQKAIPPMPAFQRTPVAIGHTTILPDPDGVVRRDLLAVEFQGRRFPSMALRAALAYRSLPISELALGSDDSVHVGDVQIPTDGQARMRIRFFSPHTRLKTVPAHQVLSGRVSADEFRGKLVLIGLMSLRVADVFTTPQRRPMPATLVVANATQTILERQFVFVPPWDRAVSLGMVVVATAFLLALLPYLGLTAAVLAGFGLAGIFLAMENWILVRTGCVVSAGPALLLTTAGTLVLLLLRPFRPIGLQRAILGGGAATKRQASPLATGTWRTSSGRLIGAGPGAGIGADGTLMLAQHEARPTLGRYEVLEELGRGAMGVVFLGHDPKIHRSVAIKTVRFDEVDEHQLEAVKERFFREAESAGQLSHPNIVTIYDAGEEQGLGYIAMEILDGENLKDHCLKASLLPVPRVLEVVAKVADALDYAHSQGIVHRDIKPSNIMLMPDGTVKVTDFGIARISASQKTQSGILLGTPSYMSPQSLAGAKVDGRSDLFSLGVVLFELLTGVKPFDAETVTTLMFQIVNQPHPLPSSLRADLPPECDAVVDRALQKDVFARYQRGKDMAADLRVALDRLNGSLATRRT